MAANITFKQSNTNVLDLKSCLI